MSTVALATVVTIALGLLRAILVSLMAGETKGAFAAYLRARVHKAASKLDPDLAIEQEQGGSRSLPCSEIDRSARCCSHAGYALPRELSQQIPGGSRLRLPRTNPALSRPTSLPLSHLPRSLLSVRYEA